MRVVVPAVPDGLHPTVVPAILAAGYRAEVVPLVGDEAYHDLFCRLWKDGETFAIVEHDIEVAPGTLAALEACPEWWCANSYWIYWGDCMDRFGVPGLGCTRFAAPLIAAHPDLPDLLAATDTGSGRPPKHWMSLDAAVAQWLRGPFQHVCHRHHPNVAHHHDYVYEGAWLPDDVRAGLEAGHPLALPPPGP